MLDVIERPVANTSFESEVFQTWPAARVLTAKELAARFPKRGFVGGWELPASEVGLPEPMVLAIDREFPWALPRVGLLRQPPFCAFPHVEADGIFCLTPTTAAAASPVHIGHAIQLVREAVDAYRQGKSGANRDDFLKEFATYWQLGQSCANAVELWLDDLNTSQPIRIVTDGSYMYAGETREKLQKWLENRDVGIERVEHGLFVRLTVPLYPEQYPATSDDLVALVASAGGGALELLARSIKLKRSLVVLLGFEYGGQIIVGASFTQIESRFPHPRNQGQQFIAAPSKRDITDSYLLARLEMARFPVYRCGATRADSRYLNTRTAGHVPQEIRTISIGIIGCGAVGGTIALQLAQSGVHRLTLIDGDILRVENVGRHELNGSYIGQAKANALRSEIFSRFCDYDIKAVPKSWEAAFAEDRAVLEECDLIICATGDWLSDAHLNSVALGELGIPVLFCWVERFALAGHGVLVMPGGACLQCVKNEFGDFNYQVSHIDGDLPTDPSCGAYYQPFSAYASNQAAAMITKLALDAVEGRVQVSHLRNWIAPYDEFDRVGAGISERWRGILFTEGGFERVHRRDLTINNACPKQHGR
jgi:molybdopterin/thiamine biosynthesis adenylyltransferase